MWKVELCECRAFHAKSMTIFVFIALSVRHVSWQHRFFFFCGIWFKVPAAINVPL